MRYQMKYFKQCKSVVVFLLFFNALFSFSHIDRIHASSFPYDTTAFNVDALPMIEGKENGEVRQAGYLPNEKGIKYPLTKEFLQTFQALQTKEKIALFFSIQIDNATVEKYVKDVAKYLNTTPGFHRIELFAGKEGENIQVNPDITIKVAYSSNQECGTDEGVLGCADGEAIYLDQKATEEQISQNNTYEIQRTIEHEFFHVLGFDHTHIFSDNMINTNNQFLSIFEYQEHGQLSEEQYYKQEAPGHSQWELEKFASDYSVWTQYNNYYEFVPDGQGMISKVLLYHLNADGTIHSASVYDYTKKAYVETLLFSNQTKYDWKEKKHHKAYKETIAYQSFHALEANQKLDEGVRTTSEVKEAGSDTYPNMYGIALIGIFILTGSLFLSHWMRKKG